MTLRVVNLGLPKTGTTTIARALRRAGFRVADYKIRAHQTENSDLHGLSVAELLYKGYFESGHPSHYLSGFDAISEMSILDNELSLWPQMDFGVIDALRHDLPELKFIASWREPFEISQSMLAWSDLGVSRLPQGFVPGLPPPYGETTKQRVQWINVHYAHLRAIFSDSPNFLELDIMSPDARTMLEQFLDITLPWWGRANTNPLRAGEGRFVS